MKYLIYLNGQERYYGAENINIIDVTWTEEDVIQLIKPKELQEENLYSDPDECGISGNVYIPVSQISHITMFDD